VEKEGERERERPYHRVYVTRKRYSKTRFKYTLKEGNSF
jgi:hypothetical protein